MDGRDHLMLVEITFMLLTLTVGVMMGKWFLVSFRIYQSNQFSTALHGCHTIRLTSSLYERPLIEANQKRDSPTRFFGWEIEVASQLDCVAQLYADIIEPKFYELLYISDLK